MRSDNDLLKEAVVDMCKQLISLFKDSPIVLELCLEMISLGMSFKKD